MKKVICNVCNGSQTINIPRTKGLVQCTYCLGNGYLYIPEDVKDVEVKRDKKK